MSEQIETDEQTTLRERDGDTPAVYLVVWTKTDYPCIAQLKPEGDIFLFTRKGHEEEDRETLEGMLRNSEDVYGSIEELLRQSRQAYAAAREGDTHKPCQK